MKTFKELDCGINVGLLVVLTIWTLIHPSLEMLITSYCIVGAWQVISMVVHTFSGWFLKRNGARIYYQRFTAIILASIVVGFTVVPYFLFVFYFLLVASPFLAVSYTLICFEELKQLKMAHALNLR